MKRTISMILAVLMLLPMIASMVFAVSTGDVSRIVKPLMKNYSLAQQAKKEAEDASSYMAKISPAIYRDFLPSKSILEPCHIVEGAEKPSDEFVPMTDKQRKEHRQNLLDTTTKILKYME